MLAPMCGMIDDTFTPAHHSCFLWLPVRLCIDFKILLLFFKVLYCLKKKTTCLIYFSLVIEPLGSPGTLRLSVCSKVLNTNF